MQVGPLERQSSESESDRQRAYIQTLEIVLHTLAIKNHRKEYGSYKIQQNSMNHLTFFFFYQK